MELERDVYVDVFGELFIRTAVRLLLANHTQIKQLARETIDGTVTISDYQVCLTGGWCMAIKSLVQQMGKHEYAACLWDYTDTFLAKRHEELGWHHKVPVSVNCDKGEAGLQEYLANQGKPRTLWGCGSYAKQRWLQLFALGTKLGIGPQTIED